MASVLMPCVLVPVGRLENFCIDYRLLKVAVHTVWTPLIQSTMDDDAQDGFSGTPMGRGGQPSEIATCFVFLASQDSSFMSGQSLHPNGGVIVNG